MVQMAKMSLSSLLWGFQLAVSLYSVLLFFPYLLSYHSYRSLQVCDGWFRLESLSKGYYSLISN